MHKATRMVGILGLVLMLVLAAGCVTNKKFSTAIDGQDAKIDEVQSGVEANERRIGDLRTEVDSQIAMANQKSDKALQASGDAMSAAKAAEAKAAGKVLWKVTLTNKDVRFDLDKAVLTAEGKATLDELIGKVKAYQKAAYVEIEGHTDSTGAEKYNMALGHKRALAVRSYMSQQGIALHMISVISFGESNPVADNSTKEGRAQNRRVVVRVLE